jgi:hypothetical protein
VSGKWQSPCWGLERRGVVSLEECHRHCQNPQAWGFEQRDDERLEDETLLESHLDVI